MSLSGAVSGLPDKALASRGRSLSEEGRSWLWQDKSKLYNDLQQIFLYMERLRVTVSSISYPSILTASSRVEMALLVVAISSNKGIALCRACKIKPRQKWHKKNTKPALISSASECHEHTREITRSHAENTRKRMRTDSAVQLYAAANPIWRSDMPPLTTAFNQLLLQNQSTDKLQNLGLFIDMSED